MPAVALLQLLNNSSSNSGQSPARLCLFFLSRRLFSPDHALLAHRVQASRGKTMETFQRDLDGRRKEGEREWQFTDNGGHLVRTNRIYRVRRGFAMSGRLFFYGFSCYALFNRRFTLTLAHVPHQPTIRSVEKKDSRLIE